MNEIGCLKLKIIKQPSEYKSINNTPLMYIFTNMPSLIHSLFKMGRNSGPKERI